MTYLGKNVNLAMLIILIGLVVGIAGLAVFYQRSLDTLHDHNKALDANLTVCAATLQDVRLEQANTLQQLNTSKVDVQTYDKIYEQKVQELKDTQATLVDTQKKLTYETILYNTEKTNRENVEQELSSTQSKLAAAQQDLQHERSSLSICMDDLRSCRASTK